MKLTAPFLLLLVLPLPAFAPILALVFLQAHRIAPRNTFLQDPREQQIRERAYAVIFRIVRPAMMVGALYLIIWDIAGRHWFPSRPSDFSLLFTTAAFLVATGPELFLVWTDPAPGDEKPDREEEAGATHGREVGLN